MKKSVILMAVAAFMLSILSCENDKKEVVDNPEGGEESPSVTSFPVSTDSVSAIGYRTALLNGSLTAELSGDQKPTVGFYYSENPAYTDFDSIAVRGEHTYATLNESGQFTAEVSNLKHSTEYHYVAYSRFEDIISHGEVLSFTTRVVAQAATDSATDVRFTSASLNGHIDADKAEISNAVVGFYYSNDASCSTRTGMIAKGTRVSGQLEENGHFSAGISNLRYETEYYYMAFLQSEGIYTYGDILSFTTHEERNKEMEKIDLGLSVMWGSSNVYYELIYDDYNEHRHRVLSVLPPEQKGGYYPWGELVERFVSHVTNTWTGTVYSWEYYKYSNGDGTVMNKYNETDQLTVLEAGDDVARQSFGGNWRMPTKEEFQELISECTWEETRLNGASGYKVTGKNGNSIFLPYSGYGDFDDSWRFEPTEMYDWGDKIVTLNTSKGYYWSSTVSTEQPRMAWALEACTGNDGATLTQHERRLGMQVRPVYDPR